VFTQEAKSYFAVLNGTKSPVAQIAKALKVSRAAVNQWGEIVPELSAYRLQSITRGRLRVRKDCYPREAKKKVPA
jgi:DNA-binding transcriptional regulator YdaS (Cro superfamily)